MRVCSSSVISDVILRSNIHTARRSAEYDVATAWRVLLTLTSSEDLLPLSSKDTDMTRLLEARALVKSETNRCARNPPKFSGDGRVALIRISSAAQIHPVCLLFRMLMTQALIFGDISDHHS